MVNDDGLTVLQKDIFDKITKNDVGGLKFLLSQLTGTVDFVDENGMTPLQHACYKGNVESVQMLLDQVSENVKSLLGKRNINYHLLSTY